MNKETNELVLKEFNKMLENTGLRVDFVSGKMGIAKQTVSSWRNGKFYFSIKTLNHITAFINKANKIYGKL
ncbi:helix-turn-helix transcriptional regulator [Bacillus thuringiensis]|nr:helix-turn-helix transcriptional regulator [Bacillus cereus]MED2684004.1 helix-turn-helix transcriptional regulator [Bacillus thuringiensis]HDX9563614.1 helix-turn-helix transcriptional regulator [Bacillus thuringiensis]HDX9701767.1 helix-turn-helix transcriptional regulator [Bacillus thuringiensis]